MSAPLRGLPPPAAMTLPHQQPPSSTNPPPPPPHAQGPAHPQAPPLQSSQSQSLGQLPAPPQWQGGSDEPMRSWLHAKAEEERRRQEEEKRRQEEERTRQESLRLEQRKIEQEILRQSLNGGVPPPLIPVLFAGIGSAGGGAVSQSALELAQQYMLSQPPQHLQLMPPQGNVSPEHRRDSQTQGYGQYPSSVVPSTPGSAPSQSFNYPGSPRTRGHSISVRAAGSTLPNLNTGMPPSQGGPAVQAHQTHPQSAPAQQEAQGSPIYFHHWQPPTTQTSSSNQPTTPSVGESPRKRKATGPQPGAPHPSSQQRFRSPPFIQGSGSALSNPPPGRRRGHSRQRSDFSSYRAGGGRGRVESLGSHRGPSPSLGPGVGLAREGTAIESSQALPPAQPPQQTRTGAHSVSSLLSSDHPSPQNAPYPPPQAQQQALSDADRRNSPHQSQPHTGPAHPQILEEQSRGGMAGPSTSGRERDND